MEQTTCIMPANSHDIMTSSEECQIDGSGQENCTKTFSSIENIEAVDHDLLYMECDDDSESERQTIKTEPAEYVDCGESTEEVIVDKHEDIAFNHGDLGQSLLDLKVELNVRHQSSNDEDCESFIEEWPIGADGTTAVDSDEDLLDGPNAGDQGERFGTDIIESRCSADDDQEHDQQSNHSESERTSSSDIDADLNMDYMNDLLMDYSKTTCLNSEMKANSRKRNTYTIEFKLCVVDYAKEHSHRKAAKTFGIHRKNVSAWTQAEDRLRSRQQNQDFAGIRCKGAGRKVHDPVIERDLLLWMLQRKKAGLRVTGKKLQEECLRRHRLKGDEKFKASEQWLRRFKKRHKMFFQQSSQTDLAEHAEQQRNENMQLEKLPSSEHQKGSDQRDEPCEDGQVKADGTEYSGPPCEVRDQDCAENDQIDDELTQELYIQTKRNSYSVDFKIKVLEYARAHSNTSAAKIFGVSRKGVTDWRKEEQELRIRNETESNKSAKRKPGAGKKVLDMDVEAALLKWVFERRSMDLEVNAKLLKSESLKLHVEHGYTGFKASSGWLHRFRERNNVLLKRSPRVNKPRDIDSSSIQRTNNQGHEKFSEENDGHSTVLSGKEPGTCQKSFNLDNELELLQWIAQRSKTGLQIMPKDLKEESTRIHEQTGNPEYTASDSWLRNFQKRNGISFRKTNKNSKNMEMVFGEKNHAFDVDDVHMVHE